MKEKQYGFNDETPPLNAGITTNRSASFAIHIRPLFTKDQKDCMSSMIDLDNYNEVKTYAEAIYSRLQDKTMPVDNTGPWPNEWIILFRRWIDEGCAA